MNILRDLYFNFDVVDVDVVGVVGGLLVMFLFCILCVYVCGNSSVYIPQGNVHNSTPNWRKIDNNPSVDRIHKKRSKRKCVWVIRWRAVYIEI